MIFTNCKKMFLLVLFASHINIHVIASEIQPSPSSQENQFSQEEILNILEEKLTHLLAQYNAVDMILEDLALSVNNDQIARLKNKRVLVEEIKNIRSIIDSVQKDAHVDVNPATLYLLIKILDGITKHITVAVENGFTQLPEFDLGTRVKAWLQEEVDLDNLDADLEIAKKRIDNLDKLAKSAGLLWYNKVYRKIDDYIIQPSMKYHVPQRVGKLALLWYFFWFHTERGTSPENEITAEDTAMQIKDEATLRALEKNCKISLAMAKKMQADLSDLNLDGQEELYIDQIPPSSVAVNLPKKYYDWEYWLRKKTGPYYHTTGTMGYGDMDIRYHTLAGKNKLQFLGHVDRKLNTFKNGLMPIGALALALYPDLFFDEFRAAKEWIVKKATALHYKLKGGVYKKKAQETENKVEPKVTFDDLVGAEHAKKVLSVIVKYIEDPERWDRGRFPPEKGYILTGPTRTGKSYMAEALAGEIKKVLKKKDRNPDEFGFYVISASQIIQLGIGKILEFAKAEAPCVLFIDEIDLLGLQRVGNKEILHEFLSKMSGVMDSDPKKQVIILAATNKPQNLDDALKQYGRFGKEIRFEHPSVEDRRTYLVKRLNNLSLNLDVFNIDKLVLETDGCTFEDLNVIIKRAFQKSKILGHVLNQEYLEEALDTEVRNIILDDSKTIPENEKTLIAAHQAGHALATSLLKTNRVIAKVTIRPVLSKVKEESIWVTYYQDDKTDDITKQKTIEYGKMFTYTPYDTLHLDSRQEKINHCKIELAGHAAEEILFNGCGYSYHAKDKEKALEIAKSIMFEGLRIDIMPKKVQNEMIEKALDLLNTCKKEVTELLEQHKDKLQALTSALQQKLSLTSQEIDAIININKPQHQQSPKNADIAKIAPVNAQDIARDLGFQELSAEATAPAA